MFKKFNYFLPNIKQSWIIVIYIVIFGSILGALVKAILSKFCGLGDAPILTPIMYIITLSAAIIYIAAKAKSAEEMGQKPVPVEKTSFGRANPILVILSIIPIMYANMLIMDPIISLIPMPDSFAEIFEQMLDGGIYSILSVVILAPLLEEYFIRGMMTRGMLYHTTPTKAIVWSALIFAVIHMNPWQAINAFSMGVFFGWLYYRTQSLYLVIFAHFVNNGSAVLFSKIFPNSEDLDTIKQLCDSYNGTLYYIIFISVIITAAFGVNYLIKNLPKPEYKILREEDIFTEELENESNEQQ